MNNYILNICKYNKKSITIYFCYHINFWYKYYIAYWFGIICNKTFSWLKFDIFVLATYGFRCTGVLACKVDNQTNAASAATNCVGV